MLLSNILLSLWSKLSIMSPKKFYSEEQQVKFETIAKNANNWGDAMFKLAAAGCDINHADAFADDWHTSERISYD